MNAETYTGKPCASGHTLRYRSNRKCVTCSTKEVRYIETRSNGTFRMVGPTELEYAKLPGRTYWRATRVE